MQELAGPITALDPDASETLKVIAYFDALSLAGVSVEALVRGAAALSGTVAGAEHRGRVTRRTPGGHRAPEPERRRSCEREGASGRVWLEREGRDDANDAIVLERLALSIDLLDARRTPTSDLEVVLDPDRSATERAVSLTRLRIDPGSEVRIVATHAGERRPSSALAALMPTQLGILQATLWRADGEPPSAPAGIGIRVPATHAHESWESAVIALHLCNAEWPVVDATFLGALLLLARAYDPEHPHDDVVAIARLDKRSGEIAQVLVSSDSLRAAATTLGMHHSTLQAKHEWLTEVLGYDPRSINGRLRFGTAEMLRRLTDPRALP